MCLKKPYQPITPSSSSSSTLNPTAQEWRPSPPPPLQHDQLLPHLLFKPPSSSLPPSPTLSPLPLTSTQTPVSMASPHNFTLSPYTNVVNFTCYHTFQLHYTPQPVFNHLPTLISFPATGIPISIPIPEMEKVSSASVVEITGEDEEEEKKINLNAAASETKPAHEEVVVRKPSRVQIITLYRKSCRKRFPPRLRKAAATMRPFIMESSDTSSPAKREWRPKNGTSTKCCAVSPLPPVEEDTSSPGKTTLMLRNLPNQIRRDFMLKFLDAYCHDYNLEYDFLYLPMDFRTKDNLGYAFVNLTTNAAALKMMQILNNFKWGTFQTDVGSFTSKKICEVSWARIQGKQNLINRFQSSSFACSELDFLPVVLDPPRNGSDPNPSIPLILGSARKRLPPRRI